MRMAYVLIIPFVFDENFVTLLVPLGEYPQNEQYAFTSSFKQQISLTNKGVNYDVTKFIFV